MIWNILLFLFFFVCWILLGGLSLWIGSRFLVKVPKATFFRSIAALCIAAVATLMISVLLFVPAVLLVQKLPFLIQYATLVGSICGLIITLLIIAKIFSTSFLKAILAWLPTIPVAIIIFIGLNMTVLFQTREVFYRKACLNNLRQIRLCIDLYQTEQDGYAA